MIFFVRRMSHALVPWVFLIQLAGSGFGVSLKEPADVRLQTLRSAFIRAVLKGVRAHFSLICPLRKHTLNTVLTNQSLFSMVWTIGGRPRFPGSFLADDESYRGAGSRLLSQPLPWTGRFCCLDARAWPYLASPGGSCGAVITGRPVLRGGRLPSLSQDLGEQAAKHGCRIQAYRLMTNHVHLLVTPVCAETSGLMMKHHGQRYVRISIVRTCVPVTCGKDASVRAMPRRTGVCLPVIAISN